MKNFIGMVLLFSSLATAGGGFFLNPGVVAQDIDPIKKLVETDKAVNSYKFDISNKPLLLHGFGFFWGSNSEGRLGVAVNGGYQHFKSKDGLQDSVMDLYVVPVYGTLLLEKGKSFGNINIYGGCDLGCGATMVIKSTSEKKNNSAFDNNHNSLDDSTDINEDNIAVAPYFVFGVHAGATVSLNKWVHIGLEGVGLAEYASEGFIGATTGSFTQFMPGVRMRIVFGTIG